MHEENSEVPVAHLPKSGWTALNEFVSLTAMNGLKHIQRGKSKIYKILWAIIFLASSAIFIFHSKILIEGYLEYESVTSFAKIPIETLDFPQISFCNMNPVRKSVVAENIDILPTMFQLVVNRTRFLSVVSGDNNVSMTEDQMLVAQLFAQSETSDQSDIMRNFFFSRTELDIVGFSADELLFSCNWNNLQDCSYDSLQLWRSSRFGNCYTWNANGSNHRVSRIFGENTGVKLVFRATASEYGGLFTETQGIRVIITPQGYAPEFSSETLGIGTAHLNSVALQAYSTFRLPKPYRSDCISQYPAEFIPYLPSPLGKYSIDRCLVGCEEFNMAHKCQCTKNLNLDFVRLKQIHGNDFRYCDPFYTSRRDFQCAFEASDEVGGKGSAWQKCVEVCKIECERSWFEVQHTAIPWPTGSYTKAMVSNNYWSESEVKTDYTKIHVYFRDDYSQIIEEKPSNTFPNLISSLGGIGGLYIGISLIVAIECLELLAELIVLVPFGKCFLWVRKTWIRHNLIRINSGRIHALRYGSRKAMRKITSVILPPQPACPQEDIVLGEMKKEPRARMGSMPPRCKIDL